MSLGASIKGGRARSVTSAKMRVATIVAIDKRKRAGTLSIGPDYTPLCFWCPGPDLNRDDLAVGGF